MNKLIDLFEPFPKWINEKLRRKIQQITKWMNELTKNEQMNRWVNKWILEDGEVMKY